MDNDHWSRFCPKEIRICASMEIASQNGCVECLPRFIEDVNTLFNGWSPIHIAIEHNDRSRGEPSSALPFIKKLIEYGADVNSLTEPDREECTDYGWSPLHHAIMFGYDDIVELLLKSDNIKVDIISRNYRTPLYQAIVTARWYKRAIAKCISLLLQYGADPYYKHPRSGLTCFEACGDDEDLKKFLEEEYANLFMVKEPSL